MPNSHKPNLDILSELKEIQFYMDQISPDPLDNIQGSFFTRARNTLTNLVLDGEARLREKLEETLYPKDTRFDERLTKTDCDVCQGKGCIGLCPR